MLRVLILLLTMSASATTSFAQQTVNCHSGGTGTIPECQRRDALAQQQQQQRQQPQQQQQQQTVQCHSGGTGTIPECQRRDAMVQPHQQTQQPQPTTPRATTPATATTTPAQNAPRGVTKTLLGTGTHSDNCALFARDKVPTLPYGLDTWNGKLNAMNSNTPKVGSVAMIGFSSGAYKDIGHAAVVESVSGNSITIIEANYTAGKLSRRTATGADLADAARQLGIAGYYQPH